MKNKLLLITSLLSLGSLQTNAGEGKPLGSGDIFGTRVFVENRGQFDKKAPKGETIHFALENGPEKIYFTSSGLLYEQRKLTLTKRDKERIEEDPHATLPLPEYATVSMKWKDANQNITIEKSEKQSHYITYGTSELNSSTFKKIVYKNVYDGIDVEFTFPSDHEFGIKYNVILHPGADLSKFQMVYGGEYKKMRLEKNGDIVIETAIGEIIEHAPKTFYQGGEPLTSAYSLDKNVITFELPSNYNKSRTVTIDPWLTTVTTLATTNLAFDVDYDFFGAVYVYGGTDPYKVAKYNSTGSLLWTFSGTLSAPTWSTGYYAGNFAVHKYNQKIYVGQGFDPQNEVIRLDPTGAYDNFITTPDDDFKEVWDMGFHCINGGQLFVLGGGTSANISAVTIDPVSATMTLSTFQPTNLGAGQDVASHAIDDAGRVFILYAGSAGLNNMQIRVNLGFNNNDWTVASGYTTFNETGNKNGYPGGSGLSSNGFNALAVNANYLFYYNGKDLAAYNKNTGAQVANTSIAAHTVKAQGGIAVDDCNNIYVGGVNQILGFNFNGTTFSTLTPIAVNATTTVKNVFDIKLDKNGKQLYISGSGFVGVYSPVHTLACPTASSICFSYQLMDHVICAGTSVTLSSNNTQTLTNASYTLLPPNTVNSTGSFVVSPTVTTSYTIFLTGTDSFNTVVTGSAVSNVTVQPQPLVAPTVTNSGCTNPTNGFNLNLTWNPPNANPGYTVTWAPLPNGITNPQQTSATNTITAGVYNATVTANGGCSAITAFTIAPTPEPSVFYVVPTGPYVLTCYNPSITFSMNPATYNYTTTNQITSAQFGPNPSITFTNSQGTYIVYGEHPVSGCISTHTFAVTQNTFVPTSALTPTFQNITCTVNSIQTITASISPTVNIEHQWISPQNTTLSAQTATAYFVPGGPGVYQHCAVNLVNGCRTCKTFTVTSNDGFPTFTIQSSPANFTLGCSTKSVTTIQITNAETQPTTGGSISYTLLAPNFAGTVPNGTLSTLVNYPVSVPGNYTVITRDNSNTCDTKVYVSVVMNTVAPMIDTLIMPYRFLTCTTPTMVLQGLSSTPNVFEKWVLPGNVTVSSNTLTVNTFTSNTTQTVVGTYTYHVLENNNLCTNQQTVTVLQTIIPPIAGIAGTGEITCKTTSVTLSNISSSRVPPFFNGNNFVQAYLWTGPSPQVPLQASSNYVAFIPGTYTLIARDMSNGCFASTTKTVVDNREYPLVFRPIGVAPEVLDCGADTVSIRPSLTSTSSSMSYTWLAFPSNLPTGPKNNKYLIVQQPGEYQYIVQNNINGCKSQATYYVVNGTLQAAFVSDKNTGYAPLSVSFTNTSRSTIDTNGIRAVWSFGNGTKAETNFSGSVPKALYTQPGTYEVSMFVFKGSCADTVIQYINVEIPSSIEIPNVFTPNGDGTNDLFFLNIANISKVQMTIYDRWGNLVYDLSTEKGNVEWDGNNQKGKPVPDGVYMYVIKAAGKDDAQYEHKGNITLVR